MSPLDEKLLAMARDARVRYEEAEAQLRGTKATYHSLIRSLAQADGSAREIAEALGVSHQRINQIVNGQGAPIICSFCRADQHERSKIVAGPDVYICDVCIGAANLEPGAGRQCSFCGKKTAMAAAMHVGEDESICDECIALCHDILREDAAGH